LFACNIGRCNLKAHFQKSNEIFEFETIEARELSTIELMTIKFTLNEK